MDVWIFKSFFPCECMLKTRIFSIMKGFYEKLKNPFEGARKMDQTSIKNFQTNYSRCENSLGTTAVEAVRKGARERGKMKEVFAKETSSNR